MPVDVASYIVHRITLNSRKTKSPTFISNNSRCSNGNSILSLPKVFDLDQTRKKERKGKRGFPKSIGFSCWEALALRIKCEFPYYCDRSSLAVFSTQARDWSNINRLQRGAKQSEDMRARRICWLGYVLSTGTLVYVAKEGPRAHYFAANVPCILCTLQRKELIKKWRPKLLVLAFWIRLIYS